MTVIKIEPHILIWDLHRAGTNSYLLWFIMGMCLMYIYKSYALHCCPFFKPNSQTMMKAKLNLVKRWSLRFWTFTQPAILCALSWAEFRSVSFCYVTWYLTESEKRREERGDHSMACLECLQWLPAEVWNLSRVGRKCTWWTRAQCSDKNIPVVSSCLILSSIAQPPLWTPEHWRTLGHVVRNRMQIISSWCNPQVNGGKSV